jgi:hypothetical protein
VFVFVSIFDICYGVTGAFNESCERENLQVITPKLMHCRRRAQDLAPGANRPPRRSTFDLFAIIKHIVDAGGQFRSLAEPVGRHQHEEGMSDPKLIQSALSCTIREDGTEVRIDLQA